MKRNLYHKILEHDDPDILEMNLNEFSEKYPLSNVRVWTECDVYYAHISYVKEEEDENPTA